jgi:hypothetical protein
MILQNDRTKDAEDVGVLFRAIISYAEASAENLERSLDDVGYANMLELAQEAAYQVALLHDDEGGSWDGVVWYNRLANFGDDSLAANLFATDDLHVHDLVVKWLLSFGYVELSHGGKRWSFDADELAEWEEGEDEGFHFLTRHGLANPTVESITRFINHL